MVDPANSPLGRMLLDEITPVVMVLRTPFVEESCQKNDLSLVEMLSPFCVFNNIDVPVRTASDQPYRLRKFKLRLFYASDVRQPNIELFLRYMFIVPVRTASDQPYRLRKFKLRLFYASDVRQPNIEGVTRPVSKGPDKEGMVVGMVTSFTVMREFKDGEFSTKVLDYQFCRDKAFSFPWKIIWGSKAQNKWLSYRGRWLDYKDLVIYVVASGYYRETVPSLCADVPPVSNEAETSFYVCKNARKTFGTLMVHCELVRDLEFFGLCSFSNGRQRTIGPCIGGVIEGDMFGVDEGVTRPVSKGPDKEGMVVGMVTSFTVMREFKDGEFSTKVLDYQFCRDKAFSFPWKIIWGSKAQNKWLSYRGRWLDYKDLVIYVVASGYYRETVPSLCADVPPVSNEAETSFYVCKNARKTFGTLMVHCELVAKERLKQVITLAGEKDLSTLYSDPPPTETVLTSSQPDCLPSWFHFFNKELVRAVSFSEHEAFDHPVACLLVVSSKDEEPINKFVDLFNTNQLPSLLNDGAMDPKILKHFLLVHDNQDGTLDRATKILTEMKNTFGANDCRLLCINSSQDGSEEHQENPWDPYKTDAANSNRLGCFLNIDDLDELKNIMQDLSSKHIIPHMEHKIRVLNEQVSATRKGFRNQIKNLWWRKGKEDIPASPSGPMYTFNSIESQMRILGDYAFMLRDYELALSNYRLLSTDYKLDKSWKQYAGVQEMMGLTYFMSDQLRKDAEYCMENAFNTYLKVGLSGPRNATRCGLWWVEMLKTMDQYKEAASVYFRISGEEPLHSAVMLEQASYCYLFSKPPMLRKYGFHLILSGDLYKKCDQMKHAIRTYRAALSVFKGTMWSHINDHVHFHIGKWYAFLGMFDMAIKHLLEVLACSHQSKMTQELFLRDFFQIVQEPLHSAVMLEQASYCYLFSKPPMLRKYGFHLILSGDLYKKCDQMKHAIRTYRAALSVFKGTMWSHINDHVHFHIGKWYAFLGMFDMAIKHLLEVLACSHQSKMTQELFLRDFFQIVQKAGKTFEVLRLQLPVVNVSSLKVVFEDHRTYASPEAVNVSESLWKSLEEDVIPPFSIIRTNWLESQAKLVPTLYKESNICVAGEAITVVIGFKNPLQIPVSISSASLTCEHSAQSDEMKPGANSSTTGHQIDEESRKLATSGEIISDMSAFTLSEVDILLGGGETIEAQLTVTPKEEGILKIVGVKWKLSGSVIGFHKFESDLVKRKVAKGRRNIKTSMKDNLKFLVIKSLPKLEGFIDHMPKTVYAGDLRRLALELKNPSEIPVKSIKMRINHPRFLNIGNPEVMNMEFPACLVKKENSIQSNTNKASDSVFVFPENTVIRRETPLSWPLWLRAAAPGNISLYLTICFEMGDESTVMRYRTLRMHYNLEVLPSLDVSFQISSCPSRLQEFLVRMDVVNRTSSESFQVHQLSFVGKQWEISLLQPIDTVLPLQFLMAGQALACFFKLKNCRKPGTDEDKVLSLAPLDRTDARLRHGSSEALFDVYNSPLIDFHHYERVHQEMSDQGHQGTIDFILMTQMQSDNNPGLPNSRNVFSHHVCHCSLASTSPIWWQMDGPCIFRHNFSASFCEINLRMTIHNSSDVVASIRIKTSDSNSSVSPFNSATSVSSGDEAGWHDMSLSNDGKVTSDVLATRVGKSLSPDCVSPFIWSGSSSTRIKLDPLSTTKIPLQICVFSPGTFDLSDYVLHWNLLSPDDQEDDEAGKRPSSGTCQGHPYYLTVLQQD
ncbi:unnamed protein product [Ilex paraguariensis]|uniref:Trafficking protein particle complex subunit 8 n=1 Tax=Ilex paraguariensis TaxID=185542 RepID=A0ABC8S727_9AQUA